MSPLMLPVWWVTDDAVVVVSEGLPSVTLIQMIQLSCWKILTTDILTELPRELSVKANDYAKLLVYC